MTIELERREKLASHTIKNRLIRLFAPMLAELNIMQLEDYREVARGLSRFVSILIDEESKDIKLYKQLLEQVERLQGTVVPKVLTTEDQDQLRITRNRLGAVKQELLSWIDICNSLPSANN